MELGRAREQFDTEPDRARESVTAAHPGMRAVRLDVADAVSIAGVVPQVLADYPELNVVINNAGIMFGDDPGEPLDDKMLTSIVATNLLGPVRLNSALTGKFVGTSVKNQEANSFFIPHQDVVSGFYTADPAATSFSSSDPRLMFLVAYLAGTGNAHSALHEFMTNHTFTNQQQVSAGPKGGVAACGLLPQAHHASPVTHCMWADGDTYADFYAWNSSPSALAKTMIGIRSKVELGHS